MASKMHPTFDESNASKTSLNGKETFHDYPHTGKVLELLTCEVAKTNSNRKLEEFCKEINWENQVQVVECAKPKTWRLMQVDDEGNGTNWELVFRIVGAVAEIDLPPFAGPLPRDPTKWRQKYLKQGLRVDGLHTPVFDTALDALGKIHNFFDEYLGTDRIQPLEVNERQVLDASNRYLTPRKDAGGAEAIAFGEGVDPKGLLQKLAGNDYVHTHDNEVLYFKRVTATDGTKIHVTALPQSIRRGDIVELEVSFVAVPLAGVGEKVKLLTVLRSITLLDRAFRITELFPTHKPENGKTKVEGIKRKIGYGKDEDRKNMMEVDSVQK